MRARHAAQKALIATYQAAETIAKATAAADMYRQEQASYLFKRNLTSLLSSAGRLPC